MSKFNQYAKRLNATVKEAFQQYRAAEKAVKKAESRVQDWKNEVIKNDDYERLAQKARANADYEEARANLRVAGAFLRSVRADVAVIREELTAAIESAYCVDPEQIDGKSLELLKSGIMNARDYQNMLRKAQEADNVTMVRLIGKYANDMADRADKKQDQNSRAQFNAIAEQCRKGNDGSQYLKTFDSLANAFAKCTENTAMIDKWDSMTGETVENF